MSGGAGSIQGAEVGPVLQAGAAAEAVVEAIRRLNANVRVVDRGAYLRVLVPGRCRVTRAAIEQSCGASVHLPAELEAIMPSFKGTLTLSDDEAVWEARSAGEAG